MQRYYLTILIFFASALSATQPAPEQMRNQDCLSILNRLLLNQQTTLHNGGKITFCDKPYRVSAIENTLGNFAVSLQSCSTCQTITLKGSGMYLTDGSLALYVKQISVSDNPNQ